MVVRGDTGRVNQPRFADAELGAIKVAVSGREELGDTAGGQKSGASTMTVA